LLRIYRKTGKDDRQDFETTETGKKEKEISDVSPEKIRVALFGMVPQGPGSFWVC